MLHSITKDEKQSPFGFRTLESILIWSSYPSLLLGLGYILFFSQILLHWKTQSHLSSIVLTLIAALAMILGLGLVLLLFRALFTLLSSQLESAGLRKIIKPVCLVLVVLFIVAFFSATKPAHTYQDGDFLGYHLGLSKNAWITGNWKPLNWQYFEFISLVVQYGLSFLWVSLPLLNKLPQFLILCFLAIKILIFFQILNIRNKPFAGLFSVLALFSFWGVALQVGSAMMDLPNLYWLMSILVFIASLTSNSKVKNTRNWKWVNLLFGIDLAAYLGHKSFGFIFIIAITAMATVLLKLVFKYNWLPTLKKIRWTYAAIPLLFISVPNLSRTRYYTADPFYPVFPKLTETFCDDSHQSGRSCTTHLALSQDLNRIKDGVYYKRDFIGIPKTFLRLPFTSTPLQRSGFFFGQGPYDYPLGLFWFAVWGFLLFSTLKFRKTLGKLGLFWSGMASGLYLVWYMGSQQSRWLYPCLLTLSLYWGYALAHLDWKVRTQKQTAVIALSLSIAFVFSNSILILGNQKRTLTCKGSGCLRFESILYEDFQRKCLDEPINILNEEETNHRGYLSCPSLGPTPSPVRLPQP